MNEKLPDWFPFDPAKADQAYEQMVAKEGLYGKAFFGHRKTKAEARRLNHLWKRAMKMAGGEFGERSTSTQNSDGIHRAESDQGDSLNGDGGGKEEEGTN